MANKLGDYVRQKRGNMSLRDFAKTCGVSHTHIDSIEKGYDPRTGKSVSPSFETLKKVARGIGVPLGDFLVETGSIESDLVQHNGDVSYLSEDDIYLLMKHETGDALDNNDIEALQRFSKLWLAHQKQNHKAVKEDGAVYNINPSKSLPLLDATEMDDYYTYDLPVYGEITAGPGGYAQSEYLGTEKWITNKNGSCAKCYLLKVKGDSMIPRFLPGDFAVVKPQTDVDSGDPAIVLIDGEEGTLKRIKKVTNGIILRSDNSLYTDREFYGEDTSLVTIIGKVIDIKPGRL